MCYINTPPLWNHPQSGGFSYCPHCGRSLHPSPNTVWPTPTPYTPHFWGQQQHLETNDELRARVLLEHEKLKARIQSGQANIANQQQPTPDAGAQHS